MKYYIIALIAIFLGSCVRLSKLDMNGNPIATDSIIKSDSIIQKEVANVYEVNPMKNFYSCNPDSLKVTYFSRMLEIDIKNPIGQCFGIWFKPKSIAKNTKIKFKAKYEGLGIIDFGVGLSDSKGGFCSNLEQLQYISSSDKGYKHFEFQLDTYLASSNPTLDKNDVQAIVIYLNNEKKTDIKGILTVKDIVLD